MALHCGVDRRIIIHAIPNEALEFPIHLGQQRRDLRRILIMVIRDRRDNNPALIVHANVEFCPALPVFLAMFLGMPFPLATDLHPRAVDDQVNRPWRLAMIKPTDLHGGIASRKCRMIGTRKRHAHQGQEGMEEAFGVA